MNLTFYKIIYPDGHFYIGSTTTEKPNRYFVSKHKVLSKKNPDLNSFSFNNLLIETKESFKDEQDLRNFEKQEILKFFKKNRNGSYKKINNLCLNQRVQADCAKKISEENICTECSGAHGNHFKTCSHYKSPNPCLECGCIYGHKKDCPHVSVCKECKGANGRHFKFCSKYIAPEPCSECGGILSHKEYCSKYIDKTCSECGGKQGNHKKSCSNYIPKNICEECGSSYGKHKKSCSKYVEIKGCSECGSKGTHKKWCSKYKKPKEVPVCPECGGKRGMHKEGCSKSKGKCEFCGYSLQSHRHAKDCPLHKEINKTCPECGGLNGNHKKTCSKYKVKLCSECGGSYGKHKKSCSQYKELGKCQYCGYGLQSHKHSKDCPLYQESKKRK